MVVLTLAAAGVASAQNDACWQDGYKQGFCDAKGQNSGMCLPPLPPLAPLPPLGRGDCKSPSTGWCWARLNQVTDPNDCVYDAPSEEFIEGCLAYLGIEGLENEEE